MRISDWSSDVCSSDLRRWPGTLRLTAFLIAFGGLFVMLDAGHAHLNPVGLALGLGAGVACGFQVTWIGRVMKGRDPLVVMFHMALEIGRASCRARVCQYV